MVINNDTRRVFQVIARTINYLHAYQQPTGLQPTLNKVRKSPSTKRKSFRFDTICVVFNNRYFERECLFVFRYSCTNQKP